MDDTENQPAPAKRAGTGGRKAKVTRQEAAARRNLVLQLMSQYVDEDEICMHVMNRFNGDYLEPLNLQTTPITKKGVQRLIRDAREDMAKLEKESVPLARQKQLQRLRDHLREAKRAGSWQAVATFEGLIAKIQGTLEPQTININVNAEIRDAVSGVLAQMSPDQIDQLAFEQLALIDHAEESGLDLAKLPFVTTEGVPAEEDAEAEG